MKHLKLYEEYKYFKVDKEAGNYWGGDMEKWGNFKDPNEPFFNHKKKSYKKQELSNRKL